jgi:hypothetical protein
MPHDTTLWLIAAVSGLGGLTIAAQAALSGWRGWLDLRRAELAARREPATPAGARIELADFKERIRKLEAIAAGVDL